MDMPCNCCDCGEIVDLNDMWFPFVHFGDKYSKDYGLCDSCYYELEENK